MQCRGSKARLRAQTSRQVSRRQTESLRHKGGERQGKSGKTVITVVGWCATQPALFQGLLNPLSVLKHRLSLT
jgi:hypothetical protein